MVLNSNQPRALAVKTARDIIEKKPVFVDTETTGLGKDAEIIELAIVSADGEVLMNQLFRPQGGIPKEASRVHHITDDMVKDKPLWGAYWFNIRSLFFGKTLAIYNADFDMQMIRQNNQRYRIRDESFDYFCVMRLYAQFRGEWDHQRNRYAWFRLEDAGRQTGITTPNSHRALDDALLTRNLLFWIAEQSPV